MYKWLKFIVIFVSAFLIFFIFSIKTYAGGAYYSAIQRKVKTIYYRLERKPKPVVKLNVPFHRQEHSLSCEFAALKMALNYKGVKVSESDLINQAIFQSMWGNPHIGFVGDINGKMLKTGYGVYWKPIAKIANFYRPATAFEHWSVSKIAFQIQKGNPVIIWGYAGNGKRKFWKAPDGTPILGVNGEHARVVTGFSGPVSNPSGFYLLDPIYGEIYWSSYSFSRNMAPFGNAGVVIY